MVHECDYRSVVGRFNKIASVGMFEHVGRHRLRNYFRKISSLLDDDGLFLNHGIIRPEGTTDGPETLFLQKKKYFPEASSHVYLQWFEKLGGQASRFWMWKISGPTTR
jgi:cyclopropane fatty-acyl-phospholipid synthase-like methyltransferase